jgi:hypothetical protein
MKSIEWQHWLSIGVFSGIMACQPALVLGAQPAAQQDTPPHSAPANLASGPVVLDWTPPAFAQLSALASTRSSFSLDRSMLAAAAGLMPDADPETREAIAKVDGVSVHLLRFAPAGIADEGAVDDVREAYHLRGWKHMITNVISSENARSPLHNGTTDLWLVVDGVNVRGAVALVETPKSLTLITLAGNLSPADILHLRGHFGIPRFDGDSFKDAKDR